MLISREDFFEPPASALGTDYCCSFIYLHCRLFVFTAVLQFLGGREYFEEVADQNMSEDNEVDTCCASCGIAEVDDNKFVPCDGCDLVKYCSDECRENHKSSTKRSAKYERLSYVTNYCSSNRKAVTSVTAQSAVYLYRLIRRNLT